MVAVRNTARELRNRDEVLGGRDRRWEMSRARGLIDYSLINERGTRSRVLLAKARQIWEVLLVLLCATVEADSKSPVHRALGRQGEAFKSSAFQSSHEFKRCGPFNTSTGSRVWRRACTFLECSTMCKMFSRRAVPPVIERL